jgi:hypothetical protein
VETGQFSSNGERLGGRNRVDISCNIDKICCSTILYLPIIHFRTILDYKGMRFLWFTPRFGYFWSRNIGIIERTQDFFVIGFFSLQTNCWPAVLIFLRSSIFIV